MKVLCETRDSKGRKIEVVTGYLPGEDIFLFITKSDTSGNITEQYGARPYGFKFKDIMKYDSKNRLVEKLSYEFDEEFENYKSSAQLYELNDTLADFTLKDEYLASKWKYEFNDEKGSMRETHFDAHRDSLTNENKLEVSFDTVWIEENNP